MMSTATIQIPQQRGQSRPIRQRPMEARRCAPHESEALGYVRLTRRGRLVLVLATLALAFGAFTLMSDPAASTKAAHHAAAEQVVVEPGQTLWDIAQSVAPGEDTRVVIAEIVDLNSLGSAGDIRAGQPLYVPEY
jgi:hypothetical protein